MIVRLRNLLINAWATLCLASIIHSSTPLDAECTCLKALAMELGLLDSLIEEEHCGLAWNKEKLFLIIDNIYGDALTQLDGYLRYEFLLGRDLSEKYVMLKIDTLRSDGDILSPQLSLNDEYFELQGGLFLTENEWGQRHPRTFLRQGKNQYLELRHDEEFVEAKDPMVGFKEVLMETMPCASAMKNVWKHLYTLPFHEENGRKIRYRYLFYRQTSLPLETRVNFGHIPLDDVDFEEEEVRKMVGEDRARYHKTIVRNGIRCVHLFQLFNFAFPNLKHGITDEAAIYILGALKAHEMVPLSRPEIKELVRNAIRVAESGFFDPSGNGKDSRLPFRLVNNISELKSWAHEQGPDSETTLMVMDSSYSTTPAVSLGFHALNPGLELFGHIDLAFHLLMIEENSDVVKFTYFGKEEYKKVVTLRKESIADAFSFHYLSFFRRRPASN